MPFTAQHVLQGLSNLPEDRYVNTFAFAAEIEPDHATAAADIATALEAFYTDPLTVPATARALQDWYPPHVGTVATVKVYDVADLEPREPIEITYTFAPFNAAPMPSEVSLCGSYYGSRNIPRQRGRLYIGPLVQPAGTSSFASISRPNDELMDSIRGAMLRLATTGAGAGLRWCVRSAGPYADGSGAGVVTYTPITDGWVDNAWDTQRRRGEDATLRETWTAP